MSLFQSFVAHRNQLLQSPMWHASVSAFCILRMVGFCSTLRRATKKISYLLCHQPNLTSAQAFHNLKDARHIFLPTANLVWTHMLREPNNTLASI
jgi:hypothetical protein